MNYAIIPTPKKVVYSEENFILDQALTLYSNFPDMFIPDEIMKVYSGCEMLQSTQVNDMLYLVITDCAEKAKSLIEATVAKLNLPHQEEYFLKISNKGIVLASRKNRGLLNALSSLKTIIIQSSKKEISGCEILDYPDLELRGAMFCWHQMHDFMPYFAPDINTFTTLYLDTLFDAKINTFLLEYETFFPWRKHPKISCKEALSETDIKQLTQKATERGIEIIPLVQTLGHVYHILIHDQYKRLSEAPGKLQQLCPLNKKTTQLAFDLIDETIAMHPNSRYIHLGGDECHLLGVCPECKEYVKKHSKYILYAKYYKKLTDYVINKGYIPILWHDIAIKQPDVLKEFSDKVVFQFWNYADISHGEMKTPIKKLNQFVDAKSILGGSAARAEKFHGAIHPSYSIIFKNVSEINSRMNKLGAFGSIICDWPDCGIAFMASFMPYCFQGESCWNTSDTAANEFKKQYAYWRFGIEKTDFLERLEALYGEIPFARAFQYDQTTSLNRYSLTRYDFDLKIKEMIEDGQRGRAPGDIYRLFNQRLHCKNLLKYLKECRNEASRYECELEHYILATELVIMFSSLSIGVWLAATLDLDFDMQIGYSRSLVEEDIRSTLEQWEPMKDKIRQLYKKRTASAHLENYLVRLFKPEIKNGAEKYYKIFKGMHKTNSENRIKSLEYQTRNKLVAEESFA